jgi:hypothetical protein
MSNDTMEVDSAEELSTAEDIGTGESASNETTDESTKEGPKGVEKALRDTESALKERQAEFTRLSQQYSELKGKMDAVMQMTTSMGKPKEVEQKDWMEDFTEDALVENPALALKAIRKQREEFVSVLRDRDAWMMDQIEKARGSDIDPELKTVVDGLKADPDFADLPVAKLVAMAKKMSPKKAVMEPRGSVSQGGRTGVAGKPKAGEMSPEMKQYLVMTGAIKNGKRDDTLE